LTTADGTGSPGDANTATRRAPGRPRGAALRYFCPCPRGLEAALAAELVAIGANDVTAVSGGVGCSGPLSIGYRINLHSRIASRALLEVARRPYRREADLLALAREQRWESLFDVERTLRVDTSAIRSPLKSLQFATLTVKDGIVDRFRDRVGTRPSIDTVDPDVRVSLFLTDREATLYLDLSGEPLFKRGWRADKGDAPLKETLAAAMIAASGWDARTPLYDPCCGSGTIAIEAAQIACGIAAGSLRRFAFEQLLPHQAAAWAALKQDALAARHAPTAPVFGSDVAHRMVDFAQRNAHRAGVADAVQLRGGDALQRMPPTDVPGVMLLNPPYGERIEAAGIAGAQRGGREQAQVEAGSGDFFAQLAAHWKKHYAGWTAWVLSPDARLPTKMRLKESRRIPMWNGPIECRLLRFDMVAGSARRREGSAGDAAAGA
jgi:putative N6-adenine-specific DNA methylase